MNKLFKYLQYPGSAASAHHRQASPLWLSQVTRDMWRERGRPVPALITQYSYEPAQQPSTHQWPDLTQQWSPSDEAVSWRK